MLDFVTRDPIGMKRIAIANINYEMQKAKHEPEKVEWNYRLESIKDLIVGDIISISQAERSLGIKLIH